MQPIRVSIDVPQARDDVYSFLDLLPNHQLFTDHMMRDWQFEGADRGVGGRVRVNAVIAGRSEPVEVEVIESEPPVRNVERNVGAGGRRVATGTYTLEELSGGGTRVNFEYAWQRAPLSERLAAPLIRPLMRRPLQRAMQRLAEALGSQERDPAGRLR